MLTFSRECCRLYSTYPCLYERTPYVYIVLGIFLAFLKIVGNTMILLYLLYLRSLLWRKFIYLVEDYKMQAGLMFEVLMYLNSYYFGIYAISEIMTFSVKICLATENSTYSKITNEIPLRDIAVFVTFSLTEVSRIYVGRKSDNSDKPYYIILSLLLIIPSCAGVAYFILWQTNVLRLEYMLNSFQLIMEGGELFFGLGYLFTFKSAKY